MLPNELHREILPLVDHIFQGNEIILSVPKALRKQS